MEHNMNSPHLHYTSPMCPLPPADGGIRSLTGARSLTVAEDRVLHTDKDTREPG